MNMSVWQLETLDAIPVVAVLGLGGISKHRTTAPTWFERNGIAPQVDHRVGRKPAFISLPALPEEVQLACRLRCVEEAGLACGVRDDVAHLAVAAKPIPVQAAAQERFRTVMIYAKHRAAGLNWQHIAPLIKAVGFEDVPSYETVRRLERLVEGFAPANWAPRLAPAYAGRKAKAALCEAAWTFFENSIETTGGNGKLCCIVDDQTVAKTDGGATGSRAGDVGGLAGGRG